LRTPSSTAGWTASNVAADQPSGPNGGSLTATHNVLKLYKHTNAPQVA
jgi:hypothetical protein